MKINGSSIGAVLWKLLFNDAPHKQSLSNANNQPADTDVIAGLALASGQPLRYVGPVSQTSTSAPTFGTAVLNQLGFTPVWGYSGVGVYTLTYAGGFAGTLIKKDYLLGPAGAVTGRITIEKTDDDTLTIKTYNTSNAATNALLTAHMIEILLIPTV